MISENTIKEARFRANLFLPRWSVLKNLEANPIVKSSYFWFALVPVFAKIFEKIGNEIVVVYNFREYLFHLSLPFSWQILFFSSCFFVLGSIAFKLFCPHAITEHSGFKEFNEEGKGYPQINSYYIRSFYNRIKNEFSPSARDAVNSYLSHYHNLKFESDSEIIKYLHQIQDLENLNKAYWFTYNTSNQHRLGYRCLVSLFYFLGFLLFSIVIFQNIKFVLLHSSIC